MMAEGPAEEEAAAVEAAVQFLEEQVIRAGTMTATLYPCRIAVVAHEIAALQIHNVG